jgi:hypothetical protein
MCIQKNRLSFIFTSGCTDLFARINDMWLLLEYFDQLTKPATVCSVSTLVALLRRSGSTSTCALDKGHDIRDGA